MADRDRTASLMTPSKLAQIQPRAAASPAAWLSQMAANAGHAHVRRLRELHGELQAQALERDDSALVSQLGRLAEALPRLDFGLLQNRGWWARATGKSRSAGAEFAAQFSQLEAVAAGLAEPAQALQKTQQEQAVAVDIALLETEVEYHAIDKIINQGTRWLQDMRSSLKTRQAAPADPSAQEQIRDDEARCDILVSRLKSLRAVSSAAQRTHREAQDAVARRAALLRMLQQAIATDIKVWQQRLAALAAAIGCSSHTLNVDEPMEAHRELQLCIKQAIADCAQLHVHERALAESLATLAAELDAA
jgi:hypothetical protein